MKKAFPYIVGTLVFAAMLALAFNYGQKDRTLNERISFSRNDKIPYGTYVAFHQIPYLFPSGSTSINRRAPDEWDSSFVKLSGQSIFIISPQFLASESELNQLIVFAQAGNDVFISTRVLSYEAQDIFHCRTPYNEFVNFGPEGENADDSLMVSLDSSAFAPSANFSYPGKRYESHFYKYDTAITRVLGRDREGLANFIQLKSGSGNIFLHLAPMAFTNYFLLHGNNQAYYDQVLSLIPTSSKKVTWDEYYLHKLFEKSRRKQNGWLGVLFKYPAFKWGLLTAMLTLVLFALLESRRKQRAIPLLSRPGNDSLDFVKTIGRLYYEKNDHRDLALKISLYFLEHVREKFKISTGELNPDFVNLLHFKSGFPLEKINEIVAFIRRSQLDEPVSDADLAGFHQLLTEFYQKT